MALQVLTANRLRDGEVVYLTRDGQWSADFASAHATEDAEEKDKLQTQAEQSLEATLIVEPYFFDVADNDGILSPIGQREIIRAKGPTVHPHFGKQADLLNAARDQADV
ncbi:MAG: DUF2849 domain-containing protein [Pseudomonadota bacterium]